MVVPSSALWLRSGAGRGEKRRLERDRREGRLWISPQFRLMENKFADFVNKTGRGAMPELIDQDFISGYGVPHM